MFLDLLKEIKGIVNLPIQEFEKSSDIKGFISKQWADMFKNYLSSLRNEKENKKIENSVNEMKILIQKMDIMLDSVGKNVLSKESPEEYSRVVNQQEVLSFCDYLVTAVNIKIMSHEIHDIDERQELILKLLNFLEQTKNITIDELKLFRKQSKSFRVDSIVMDKTLLDRCDILHNKHNVEKIVEILSQSDYFNKIVTTIY